MAHVTKTNSPLQTVILVCLVAIMCYEAAILAYALRIPPDHIASFWPATPFLVAVLLLAPRKNWAAIIAAGLAGMALGDLRNGVPIGSVIWLCLGDLAAVLGAALGMSRLFKGAPHLSSVKTLAQYLVVVVVLASFTSAFLGANAIVLGGYWPQWRLWYFSDALSFLTVTPAILNWVHEGRAWARRSQNYLELAALITAVILFGYLTFMGAGRREPPALLYSLVPLLLWAALRLGLKGVSTSMVIVAFLSIWGTAHGRGPFTEQGPLNNVLSMQLFLFFATVPFMFLAVLVEEQKGAQQALIDEEARLRESEERFRLAAQAGRMYAYEWDVATDKVVRSEECMRVLGSEDQPKQLTRQQLLASVHPDDRALFVNSVDQPTPENPTVQISYRVLRPDGSVVWLEKNARAFFDQQGKMLRMIGMVADVTEGKKAEEAVLQREKELLEAQRVAQVGSWQWDQKTDAVAWSKELYRIAGRDPALSPPSFKEQSQLYTPESWERLECAVAEALRTGTAYELDLRMIRPDGSTRWIIDRGEVLRDAAGQIAWLRGTAQDITERKQAEDALQASEEKFRSVFRDAGVGMVIVSPEGRFLAANEAFCDCLGYTEEELLQKTVESVTLAEDWQSFSQRLRESLERGTSFQRVEKRCLHKSGRIVITESSASLIRGPSGESRYFVGEVLDITQRKLADEALSSVSRRLIEAHEEERTRIARELHDDINQRMALLSGNLERVKEILPASDVQARALVDEAGQRVSDLASDIQSLSHRLHSSNLEYLGLVPACDGFCREVSERQKIEIDFRAGAIPKALPKEISLCLFRVLQEALMNAIKHSEARRFEVGLVNVSSDIELTVHDSGIGFDLEKAMSGQGLGLTSMRERLKLVDGQLFIDSKPQGGTTVHARVPTNARMKTAGASG